MPLVILLFYLQANNATGNSKNALMSKTIRAIS